MYIHNKFFQRIPPKNEDPTPLEGGKRKQKRKTKYRRRRIIKHKKTRKV
jgi:hypothetical protein